MKRITSLFGCFLWFSAAAGNAVVEGVFGNPVRVQCVADRATAVAVEGDVLYCGANGSLFVLDIVEPLTPRLLARVDGLDLLRQIAVDNGWVAVSSRGRGAWIVDAREPAKARIVSHYETVEQATGIEIAGDLMLVGQRCCGVEFVDITDRTHPEHIRMVQTPESQSCLYEDGYVYSGDWHAGSVTVIDARDLSQARIVAQTEMQGLGDGFDLRGDYIYAATGHHRLRGKIPDFKAKENWGRGHGLEVWDRTDRAHPKFVSRVDFPAFWRVGNDMWTARVSGDFAFCADTYNGLFAVNIVEPAKPVVVGRFTLPDSKDTEAPSRCVSYVAVTEGAVYAALNPGGLYAIPCKGARAYQRDRGRPLSNVSWRDSYSTVSTRFRTWLPPARGPVHSVALHAEFMYVGCGSAGCYVVDRDGKTCGRLARDYARDVAVSGDRLLVAEGEDGLGVYSLADPLNPKEIGRVRSFLRSIHRCEWVYVPRENLAVCSGRGNSGSGWSFVDLSDLSNPEVVGWVGGLPWIRPFASRIIGGKWLGYAQTHSFLKWFDLSGKKPAMIDTEDKGAKGPLGQRVNFIRWRDGCTAFKNDTLLLTKDGRFIQLQAAQNRNVDGTPWSGVPAVGCPRGVRPEGVLEWDGGDLVAVVNTAQRRVSMYDLSDPQKPQFVWTESLLGYPENAIFNAGVLFVPCGYQGLLSVECGEKRKKVRGE